MSIRRFTRFSYVFVAVSAALSCAACESKEATASVETKVSVDAKTVFSDKGAAQLADAASSGDAAKVDKLVKAGANPSAIGDKATSVVQFAMLNKSKAGVEALLNAGADPMHADDNGDTLMHYAAKSADPGYMDILLAHKADVNVQNTVTSATPLIAALFGEREPQFHKLLAAGANPNIADRGGNTALHIAAKINENQLSLDLLKAGADPLAKNKQGVTFQRYLNMTPTRLLTEDAKRQREAIVTWLRDHNIPVEAPPAPPAPAQH